MLFQKLFHRERPKILQETVKSCDLEGDENAYI